METKHENKREHSEVAGSPTVIPSMTKKQKVRI